jgi:F0F1-type ATP synthase assembly protein I
MTETSSFRRVAATLTIGSFSVAALMGILALLGGGSFGDNEARVLLTTLIVGSASICVLCYLATAGTRWAPVGATGGVVVLLPTITALLLVWSDWNDGPSDGLLKSFGVGVVLAVTLAQISLLLALAGEGRLGAVLWPTIGVAVVVAALVAGMILGGVGADDVWRLLGVLAILDVLGTLVTIALAKFGDRGAPPERDRRLRVTLSVEQTVALERASAGSGRSPEQLVGDVLDSYLELDTRS